MMRLGPLKYSHGKGGVIHQLFAKNSTSTAQLQTSAETGDSERIVIPKKINRRPTDLLYTLSKTIGRDTTAAHYKYIDDPFLVPPTTFAREQYALSQEAGRQTAKWIQQEHAKLFNAKDAQPQIEAFLSKPIYTDDSDVTLKNLEDAINALNVTDAILIYRLLTAKNESISIDLKQNLLELVCFYNQKDPLPFDLFEKRSKIESSKRDRDAKPETWNEGGFADQLFESFETITPAAYKTMIRALFKYKQFERAEELVSEAKEQKIPLDLATYNLIIRNINNQSLTAEIRWIKIKEILQEIKEHGIKPDIHTLNGILSTVKMGGNIFKIQEYAAQAMAEFKILGIESSLETYSHLLEIYHGKQSPPSDTIYRIVEQIEKMPELKAHSIGDLTFFYKAMVVCRYRLSNSSSITRRIDNIVTQSDNIKFLGDAHQEQLYYRYLLSIILEQESFDDFIRTYDELVPETCSLDPILASSIFSTINLNGAIQYVPKFWTDLVISSISKYSQINDSILTLMSSNQPVADVKEYEGLNDQFASIAWSIYQDLISVHLEKAKKEDVIHATKLSMIIIVLLRAEQHNNAREVFDCFTDEMTSKRVLGCLTPEALEAFIDSCIQHKEPRKAIKCIAYSVEHGVGDAIKFGRKIIQSFTLEPHETKRITDLVGSDALKTTEPKTE